MIYHIEVESPDDDTIIEFDILASCQAAAEEQVSEILRKLYPDMHTVH